MNEMSNGSHPRRALHVRRGLAAALFGGFAVTMAACPGPTPHTGPDGSGGEGSSTSSTSTSTSSSSGGMSCMTPGECPAPPNDCKTPTCEGNTCGFALVAAKKPCKDGGGRLCDGLGHCVDCITAAQCESVNPNPCNDSGVHTAPPVCNDGVCELGKAEDCEAAGLICKPAGCMPCATNTDCVAPAGGCVHKECKASLCEKESLSQGSGCLSPASGTCDATGACVSRRYVFVTSMTFLPNFGSTAMADAKCHDVAEAAGLGGKWKSWTSDSGGSTPLVRFAQSPGPYLLLDDQTIVASSWAALTGGGLMHGITLDENQQPVVSPPEVWTGTNPNGSYAGSACANWMILGMDNITGAVGMSGDATGGWTNAKEHACLLKAHLYCFQQ
jgi:hypothetical protein